MAIRRDLILLLPVHGVRQVPARQSACSKGFTVFELMVVLAVAAILVSVGIPSFTELTMNSRLIAQTNELVTSINMARSAAVRYQRNATVCLTDEFDAATPQCDSGTDWSVGWFVWVDRDRDTATDSDEILFVHEPLADRSTLTSTTTNRFSFNARGFAVVGGDVLTLCDSRAGETGRAINVNVAGRTNVSDWVCS